MSGCGLGFLIAVFFSTTYPVAAAFAMGFFAVIFFSMVVSNILNGSRTPEELEEGKFEVIYSPGNPPPRSWRHPNRITYAHRNDSGFDLSYIGDLEILLGPLERKLVPTGLRVSLPEDVELQIRPRSGNALKKGITVLNTPGTIDRGYSGEIGVIVVNLSNEEVLISPGDKIAQGVFAPVITSDRLILTETDAETIIEINKFENGTRETGGFGSTGS